jgi:hypothetical protein
LIFGFYQLLNRCATAVETRIQEDFVTKFFSKWVEKQQRTPNPEERAFKLMAD